MEQKEGKSKMTYGLALQHDTDLLEFNEKLFKQNKIDKEKYESMKNSIKKNIEEIKSKMKQKPRKLKKRMWEITIKGTDKNGDFVIIKSEVEHPSKYQDQEEGRIPELFDALWGKVQESARREDSK